MWNKDYNWFFEPGTPDGFNDGGIAEFKSTKYDGLAREIIQNSIDAKNDDEEGPVKVVFEKMEISTDEFPNIEDFMDNVRKCIDFIKDDENNRSIKDLQKILTYLNNVKRTGKCIVLKISDYNTTGLPGSDKKIKTPWANLVRISGNNAKRAGSGGSFGIGKYAPFVFSNIRALIYSTKDELGNIAVQGKTILSGHQGDGNYRTPNGYYGRPGTYIIDGCEHEDSKPFFDAFDIPDVFIRKEIGTSIFVLCASLPIEWTRLVASSVINSFFYSIYKKMLEVEIISDNKHIIINNDNLIDNVKNLLEIDSTKELKISNEYIKVIENQDNCIHETKIFDLPNNNKGKMDLYIYTSKDIEGKNIAHIRKTGMKIEDKSPRSLMNYSGIAITGNDEMNSFLTECEAPKHDMWSSNNYGIEEEQEKAKKVLTELLGWERDIVKSLTPINEDEHIDPLGMNEYLSSDIVGDNDSISNVTTVFNFEPIKTDLSSRKESSKTYTDINVVDGIFESEDGEIEVETSSGNNESSGGTGSGNGGTPNVAGTGNGNRSKIESIPIRYVKTPYISKGKYLVSFIPVETHNDCYIKFRSAGDDVFENLKIKNVRKIEGNTKVECTCFNIISNKKVLLEVEFEDFDRGALEVNCYVKK